jgi:hypothetical protein
MPMLSGSDGGNPTARRPTARHEKLAVGLPKHSDEPLSAEHAQLTAHGAGVSGDTTNLSSPSWRSISLRCCSLLRRPAVGNGVLVVAMILSGRGAAATTAPLTAGWQPPALSGQYPLDCEEAKYAMMRAATVLGRSGSRA